MKKIGIKAITICASLVLSFSSCQSQQTESDAAILDSNKDGIISPYEALDVLKQMKKQAGGDIQTSKFCELKNDFLKERENGYAEMFQEFDKNNDGLIKFEELSEESLGFIKAMDADNSKSVDIAEMSSFDEQSYLLDDEEQIQEDLKNTFADYNVNDSIKLSDVEEDQKGRFSEWDFNKDEIITREEMLKFSRANNTPVRFEVVKDTAYMTGVITGELPATVLQLIIENPNVSVIEMLVVPGSIDDVANLRASLLINKFGITTKLNKYSLVASGGTDFFTAGKERIVDEGAYIGVHSWGGGAVPAAEVPRDAEVHQKYLEFYRAVGIDEEFYWYTLEAAPAGDMHKMTEEEITKYKIRTK